MRTIAVIARKGGSGKTTVATHLALAAFLRGYDTVLADADPQGSASEALRGRRGPGPVLTQVAGAELLALQIASVRGGVDALIVDTPATIESEIAHAIVLADLSLLVIRPTFLDIAAAVQTSEIIRRLRRPGLILLNQAPPPRAGVEPPAVKQALAALRYMRLPVVPAAIRSRAVYQSALASGRSAEETTGDAAAASEIGEVWAFVERFAFGAYDPNRQPTSAANR
ncbi:MAG TPA: AAA family ATPase [Caulobacteraceae bacterium]